MVSNRPALELSAPPTLSGRGALHRERAREGVTVDYDAPAGSMVVVKAGILSNSGRIRRDMAGLCASIAVSVECNGKGLTTETRRHS